MRFRRKQRRLHQWQRKAACHRDVGRPRQFQHAQRVGECLFHGAISVYHAHAFHGNLRRSQCKQDGKGIVNSGIGIEQDAFGSHAIAWRERNSL